MTCNAFDLDAEPYSGRAASYVDRGGNVCSCKDKTAACKALSASLAPPEPVAEPEP